MGNTLPDRVRLGVFEVDLRAGELRDGKSTVSLQEQPLLVLRLLVEEAGGIVTREEIRQKLWPNDTVVDWDRGINTAIRKLRQALRDSAEEARYVETIGRRGYRLLVPVERIPELGDPSSSSDGGGVSNGGAAVLRAKAENASLVGRKVSHYRALGVIGGGGMGLVYEAEDLKLGRRVALKFLPGDLAWDPTALHRFEREARAASSLDHPNICSIYEIEEHEGQPFIVMPLLQGETLRDRLAGVAIGRSTLPLDELLDIATQICDGLQAAHDKGIIHRDIKPANIFLTAAGQVKILDFGLAKQVSPSPAGDGVQVEGGAAAAAALRAGSVPLDETITRIGAAMGTAGYMSPEQIRGEKLDARTDLFSVGLVLYEMATGQRAFSGYTDVMVQQAILNQTPAPAREQNATIPAKLAAILERAIRKNREERYQSAAELRADLRAVADQSLETESEKVHVGWRWKWLAAAAIVWVATIAAGLYWRSHHRAKLTAQDAIVIADFDNQTGDPVFDDTLKLGLSTELEQSPFFTLVSQQRVNQTLKEMGRQTDQRLTAEIAREVCQRTGSRAMLTGSITSAGSQYVVGLEAVDCELGNVIAKVEARAADKNAVLKALHTTSVDLRRNLGESLTSLQKYATPLEEATTPSLEALKAYSLGWKTRLAHGGVAALPLYKRAVELDPNFAMAYAVTSGIYGDEDERSAMDARTAYELRGKVSDRERFYIEAGYYLRATGELEKAARTYEDWLRTYPRDFVPYINLGWVSVQLGNFETSATETQEGIRLGLNQWALYLNLATAYQYLNRLDEAEAVYKEAEEHNWGAENLVRGRYLLAFLKSDAAQMLQMAKAAEGKPGIDDTMLALQAETEGWHGRLKNARELTGRAVDSAQHNDGRGRAAGYKAAAALREVECGNPKHAREEADAALAMMPSKHVRALAALTLARAGDIAGAERLAAELDNAFPLDTRVQKYRLPTIRAAIALQRNSPEQAIQLLKVTSPIELGDSGYLLPAYYRGEAYLALHDGKAAAAEFQKFVEHYGLVTNFPLGALARLGLARAFALEAATDVAAREKARTAYQNFLVLWKDADPDIPIYKQAQAEYAKL